MLPAEIPRAPSFQALADAAQGASGAGTWETAAEAALRMWLMPGPPAAPVLELATGAVQQRPVRCQRAALVSCARLYQPGGPKSARKPSRPP